MSGLRPTLEFRRGDELVAHAVAAKDAIWFRGHFPGAPLLPGVAMLALVEEALALFWREEGAPPAEIRAFRRIRFRRRVLPGTNLRVRARRVRPDGMRFTVEVDGLPACTGECDVIIPATAGYTAPSLAQIAPWAMRAGRGGTAFSSDGTTFDTVAMRAASLFELAAPGGSPVRVCVASEDRVDVAAAVLAALAGGIEVVFPSALAPEALVDTYAVRPFSHWIGPSDWLSRAAGISTVRIEAASVSASWRTLGLAAPDVPRVFLQTGGSTGQARLWEKTARNLLGEVVAHVHAMQVGPGDHILATVPPHHIYGLLFSVLLPLFSGATVERVSPFFPREIAERIEETAATVLVSTPAHLRALVGSPPPPTHHLRLVLSSGAPLAAADAARFFARTGLWPLEVYGSTETGGIAVRRQDVADSAWAPLPGVECRTDGDALAVRSAHVSGGARRDRDGFFRTADLANTHPDGRFDLLGRDDGVVKVGGHRVELPAIEKLLVSLDDVGDAVVLSLPSESGRGQEIVALVASGRSADEVMRELRARLPPPSWPRRLRCVDTIPTTRSGKRDRAVILRILDGMAGG
jgi:acyl-CoA synthetase (AMP-forming)/AMP-acid ligase II/3-hydroxymyristoyl/3-hydroxydecanoyl-(acyl carrier protein) dehydratase